MTTGKTIALTFVGKVMSLLFNLLSKFVIAFLLRKKKKAFLLVLWLQPLSVVICEPKIIKSATFSTLFLSICHKVMEANAMSLVFLC